LTAEGVQIFKLIDDCLVHNNLKSEVKFFAAAGWVRDKILKNPRQNHKLNISFHTERADINSASISNLIKEYERYENGDIFSHEQYDEVTHFKPSKLKKMDISEFKLKGQYI
jgi:hypothetical protein